MSANGPFVDHFFARFPQVSSPTVGRHTERRDKYAGPDVSRSLKPRTQGAAAGPVPLVSLLLRFALLLLLLAPAPAAAVDPERRISQYGHTAWRIQDGFFNGVPYAIKQTADGYLWIGTANGLLRFDGVRFVPWTPPPGKQLPSSVIGGLLAARDGSLWIGTMRGFSHWTGNDLVNYPAKVVMIPTAEDENGTIWVVRAAVADGGGALCQVNGTAMRCYGKADGIPEESYTSVTRDSAGDFWMGGNTSLVRWRPGSFQTYHINGMKPDVVPAVFDLAPGPDGSLWVGMGVSGPRWGLQQLSRGEWKAFVVPGFDSSTLKVHRLFMDRQNALWVGTLGHGIYRIYGREVDHFDSSEGLSGDTISKFFEDKEGDLWVTTDKGLDCFRDLQIASFSTREGLTTPGVSTVQSMRDGSIWIGGMFALNMLGPGLGHGVASLQEGKGLPGDQVTSLFEDHAGRHWVGIEDTLNIYENGRFTRITRQDGRRMGLIQGITEDVDNNIWVLSLGPPRALIRIFDRKVKEELPTPQAPTATSLVADPRGGVWLGLINGDLARYQLGRAQTFRFEHPPNSRVNQVLLSSDGAVFGATTYGLIGWLSGKQQTLTARNGLPCDDVNGIVEDATGSLWLYMQCGLVELARSELQKWWAQPDARLQLQVFDVFDGFQSGFRTPFEGKAVRTLDGRLWFANYSVAQMIDPAHLALNLIPPPVHVEQVIADRKRYSPQGDVRLPAHTRDMEIDYTALSLAVPQKVCFRYRLEGRDTDWQEAGTRRQAFYTDLRPGTYRFHVIACNNDGIWNQQGASLDFNVMPAWYQTIWFKLLFVVIILATTWALYRLRVRQVAHALAARFDERLAERTRIAREFHDTLIQTIQGSKLVADDALDQAADPAKMRRALMQLSEWQGRAIQEGRAALNSLRTSTTETNDLAEGLRRATEECRMFSPIVASFSVDGDAREMHPVVRDEIYRIGYEAIRNACVHSKASQLHVGLQYGQDLAISVGDNGVGIPESIINGGSDGHFGLQGMRERASRIGGKLKIVTSVDSGTEVSLVVPGRIAFQGTRGPGIE
jgi:signal transduction histidine kinase/ligand-binding sensor domain-containing protein